MIEFMKRHWLPIVIAIFIIIFIIFMNQDPFEIKENELIPVESPIVNPVETVENSPEYNAIMVDVKGEVVRAGIYEVDIDSRIYDVIELAGGFSAEADQRYVNLAQRVHDEMMIIVPRIGEELSTSGAGPASSKVRINYATQEEVETLSGIGSSKAQAIIQYRDDHGFFNSVEDLLQISGIGEKTLENIKDDIQIP